MSDIATIIGNAKPIKELPVFVQFEVSRDEVGKFDSMELFIEYCVEYNFLTTMDFTMVIQGTALDLKELEDTLQIAKEDYDNLPSEEYAGHEVEVL